MEQKQEQENAKQIVFDAVAMLCKSSVGYHKKLKIQGLIGVTQDDDNAFLIELNKLFENTAIGDFEQGSTPLRSMGSPRTPQFAANRPMHTKAKMANIHFDDSDFGGSGDPSGNFGRPPQEWSDDTTYDKNTAAFVSNATEGSYDEDGAGYMNDPSNFPVKQEAYTAVPVKHEMQPHVSYPAIPVKREMHQDVRPVFRSGGSRAPKPVKPGQAARVKQTAVSASLPTPHSQFKHVPGDDGGDGSNPLIIAHTQTTFTCGCDGCGKTFQLKSSVDRHQYKDHGREKHGNRRPDDGGEDDSHFPIIRKTETTYSCGYESCGKSFQLKSSVDRHQYKDHGRVKQGGKGRPRTPKSPPHDHYGEMRTSQDWQDWYPGQ